MERFGQIVSIGDTTVLYCFGFDMFLDSFNILTVSSRFPWANLATQAAQIRQIRGGPG